MSEQRKGEHRRKRQKEERNVKEEDQKGKRKMSAKYR